MMAKTLSADLSMVGSTPVQAPSWPLVNPQCGPKTIENPAGPHPLARTSAGFKPAPPRPATKESRTREATVQCGKAEPGVQLVRRQ
jgi:hypothetical protein